MSISLSVSGNTLRAAMPDEFLQAGAEQILDTLRTLDSPVELIVLDFGKTTYVNSSGISGLIELYRYSRTRGAIVEITGLNPAIRDFFHAARLNEIFSIQDDYESLSIDECIALLENIDERDQVIDELVKMGDVALPALRTAMREGNELIRSGAIIALGRLDDAPSLQQICDYLNQDDSAEVRSSAAFSLGLLMDERAVPYLLGALEDPEIDVAEIAGASLGIIGSEEVSDALPRILHSESARVRGVAAQAIGMIADRRMTRHLLPLASDDDPWVRMCSIQALGWMRARNSADACIRALGDEDMRVREAAAATLGRLKVPETVDSLCQALHQENMWVAFFAAKALGQIGDERAIAQLMEAYEQTELENVRIAILWALRELEAPDAEPLFRAAFDSDNEDLRKEAFMGLAQVGVSDLSSILEKAIADPSWMLRYAAADVIILRRVSSLEQALKRQLGQETEELVRRQISRALAQLVRLQS